MTFLNQISHIGIKSTIHSNYSWLSKIKRSFIKYCIELSRRGYVVALIDPYAQGLSSSSLSRIAATTQGYGMFALVDYVHTGVFDFIDLNKVGATGHSMGGNAAIRGADYFGKQAIQNNSKVSFIPYTYQDMFLPLEITY